MKITTNSKKLRSYRRTLVEMILSNHEVVCPTCAANNKCELQSLANNLGIEPNALPTLLDKKPIDSSSPSIIKDPNKCIGCGRCITVCNEVQTVYALTMTERGFESYPPWLSSMEWAIAPA